MKILSHNRDRERQVLCQNRPIGIRNYFNIFGAGGGIKIFQTPVEIIQQTAYN